jgi:phosphoribosylpyrophosphate synthetase
LNDGVFALHCFIGGIETECYSFGEFINKIITTNSTGTCETQNEKRLQVIDSYDIFNDYLKRK